MNFRGIYNTTNIFIGTQKNVVKLRFVISFTENYLQFGIKSKKLSIKV